MRSPLASRTLRVVLVTTWLGAALATAAWFHARRQDAAPAEALRLRDAGRPDEAIAALRRHATSATPSADVLELLGGLEQTRGRLEAAEAAYREARRLAPARAEAALGLADVLLARKATREAVMTLADLDAAHLSVSQRERWMGLLAQAGDVDALQQAVSAVLEHVPGDPTALGHALAVAEQRHDWARAAEAAERLLVVDPRDPAHARRRLARALDASGAAAQALRTYEALDERSTWAERVALLSALGRVGEAVDLWMRHEPSPSNAAALARRAGLHQRIGRSGAAERDYRAALHLGGLDDASRASYAWLLNRAGRHEEAWALLQGRQGTTAPLELRAFTAAWAGADDAAVPLLSRWLRGHPRDVMAWTLLGEVARRRDDTHLRTRALSALAALDAGAHAELARHLAASGHPDQAIAAYAAVLDAGRPLAVDARDHYLRLLEQQGRFADAVRVVAEAHRTDGPRADLLLREARLRRWMGDAAGAVAAVERAARLDESVALDPRVQAGHARALADLARWDEAAAAVAVALAGEPVTPVDDDLHRLAAQVATQRRDPRGAVEHLQALGARRALGIDEQRWLAGQAADAALWGVALDQYERVVATAPRDADHLWRTIADLEDRQGQPAAALAAWRRVSLAGRDAGDWRRLTWAAAKVSRRAALEAYTEAFAAGVAAGDLWLEAARLQAGGGDAAEALRWYQRYVELVPAGAPAVAAEVGRTCLAAGRPADALAWIAQARALDQGDRALMALEAQALHLAGRPQEAAQRFEALVRDPGDASSPTVGEWFVWLGRAAQARNRLLDAQAHFAAALARGATPTSDLWLARGDLAARRLDLARARRAYVEAHRAGDERAASRLEGLAASRQPVVTLPFEAFGDSNDFGHVSASTRAALRPSDRARVTGEWVSGRLTQHDTAFARHAVTVAVDRVFPTEHLALAGQVSLEQARGRTQPLYRADATYAFRSGASVTAQAVRESPWRAEAWDARMRYNRITDLAVMPGDFHATGGTLGVTLPVGRHEVLGNASVKHSSDGNRQLQGYVQYQVPVSSRAATWIALQPFVYGETWQRQASAYFSPERQVTAGATVRAIVTRGAWTIDAAATPQYLDSASRSGFGYAAVGSVRRNVGRLSLGASGMIFDDMALKYRVRRVTVDVSVPVRR